MNDLQQITRRLERLERENRTLKIGLLTILMIAAACLFIAATKRTVPDVVRAKQFMLIDDDVRESASLLTHPIMRGQPKRVPSLEFYGDDTSDVRIRLGSPLTSLRGKSALNLVAVIADISN